MSTVSYECTDMASHHFTPFLGSASIYRNIVSQLLCADYKKVVEVSLTKLWTDIYHHAVVLIEIDTQASIVKSFQLFLRWRLVVQNSMQNYI